MVTENDIKELRSEVEKQSKILAKYTKDYTNQDKYIERLNKEFSKRLTEYIYTDILALEKIEILITDIEAEFNTLEVSLSI